MPFALQFGNFQGGIILEQEGQNVLYGPQIIRTASSLNVRHRDPQILPPIQARKNEACP